MLIGCDVSSYQTVATESQYSPDFVVIKSTEGMGYRNPLYSAQVAWARTNHKKVMHYHFPGTAPAASEVVYFLSNSNILPGELVCLDMEGGELTPSRAAWALQFMQILNSRVVGTPIIYLNQSWAWALGAWQPGLKSYPLWIAYYNNVPNAANTCGWAYWTFHQFTNTPIDRDSFNGDAATWAKLAGQNAPPPPPPSPPRPTPPPPVSTVVPKMLQNAIRVSIDGHWGPQTEYAAQCVIHKDLRNVKYLQARIGANQDGIWGPNSNRAWNACIGGIQQAVGTKPDYIWGPLSQTAFNRAHNTYYGR